MQFQFILPNLFSNFDIYQVEEHSQSHIPKRQTPLFSKADLKLASTFVQCLMSGYVICHLNNNIHKGSLK